MKTKIYSIYNQIFRPQSFALWAKPKKSDLSVARKRFLNDDNEVVWDISDEMGECADHIEMSGFFASAIISYGKDKKGKLRLMKHLIVPTLRI